MGNQMFQYALAKALSHKHSCKLVIDTSLCAEAENMNSSGITLRPFGLEVFGIEGDRIEEASFGKVLETRKQDRMKRAAAVTFCRIASKFSDCWRVGITERKKVGFDESLLNLPGEVVLKGYFPSFRYFQDCEDLIREVFSFKIEPGEQDRALIEQIASSNSVSLHIRRGDYISNEKTKDKFGVCTLAYYKRAVRHMIKSIENPKFFIFTNDPGFVEENLELSCPTVYATHNSVDKSYEDMRLMSLCKHNIIANSSFSWWGAWLNANPKKIVIGPTPAFDKLDIEDDDFYPGHWVKLAKGG